MTVTVDLLFILVLTTAIVAVIDGITRARGRAGGVLAILEIVVGALLGVTLFVPDVPFGATALSLVLAVVLVLALALRGGHRSTSGLTVAALVLAIVTALISLGWLTIPGLT